jgi:hypothetical protein
MSRNRENRPEPEQSEQAKRALAFLESRTPRGNRHVTGVAVRRWGNGEPRGGADDARRENQRGQRVSCHVLGMEFDNRFIS